MWNLTSWRFRKCGTYWACEVLNGKQQQEGKMTKIDAQLYMLHTTFWLFFCGNILVSARYEVGNHFSVKKYHQVLRIVGGHLPPPPHFYHQKCNLKNIVSSLLKIYNCQKYCQKQQDMCILVVGVAPQAGAKMGEIISLLPLACWPQLSDIYSTCLPMWPAS